MSEHDYGTNATHCTHGVALSAVCDDCEQAAEHDWKIRAEVAEAQVARALTLVGAWDAMSDADPDDPCNPAGWASDLLDGDVDLEAVPDDPGGLLRRKFALEYQRRQLEGRP